MGNFLPPKEKLSTSFSKKKFKNWIAFVFSHCFYLQVCQLGNGESSSQKPGFQLEKDNFNKIFLLLFYQFFSILDGLSKSCSMRFGTARIRLIGNIWRKTLLYLPQAPFYVYMENFKCGPLKKILTQNILFHC